MWAGRNLSAWPFSAPFSHSAHRSAVRSHRFDHNSTSATSTLRCSPPAITSLCSVWSLTGQCPCPGTVPCPLHRCGLERAPLSTKTPCQVKPFGGPCAAVKPASRPGTQGLQSALNLLPCSPHLPLPAPPPGILPAAPASALPRRCQAPCSAHVSHYCLCPAGRRPFTGLPECPAR